VATSAPVVVLVVLVTGILVGDALGPSTGATSLLLGGAVAIAAACSRSAPVRVILVALVVACLGAAMVQRAEHGLVASPLAEIARRHGDARVVATLVEDPDPSRFDVQVLVRVTSFDGRDAGGRRVLLTASGDDAVRVRVLSAGESIVVRGWFAELTGFDVRWRWKHAVAELHATDVLGARSSSAPLDRVANDLRTLVLGGSQHLPPSERALLAGFLLGDTRGVPPTVTEQFRAAGLSHLTAVSGGNVAFVLALFAPLLRRLGLRGRVVLAAIVLLCFGTMTRWEPSVLRAIAMAGVALLAGYLGRPAAGLRVLLLAAIVLLLADPFLLHQVGFLLSCAASLGIVLFARRITVMLRGPTWMREVLGVTAAAQLGVAPVLIPVFGSLPLVALPANLVAVPLTAPLTMWGLSAGVLGGLGRSISPAIPWVLELPTRALLHALMAVADLASRVPIAIDARTACGIVAAGAASGVLVQYRNARRRPGRVPSRLTDSPGQEPEHE
jgi:competence protein ComEC